MVELISLCTSGLEAAPAYEIKSHGYNNIDSMSGKVKFSAPLEDIPSILNNFRTVDRILIKVGSFIQITLMIFLIKFIILIGRNMLKKMED